MFACSRVVERAASNDDSPVAGTVLAEAVALCCKDAANVSKIVKGCVGKLTNSFVMVRLKSLQLLLHIAQNGPPSVIGELRMYSQAISDCFAWRADPHPSRGYEPYEEMKSVAQQILDMALSGSRAYAAPAQPRFAGMSRAPEPAPQRSIMTPYSQQATAQPAPSYGAAGTQQSYGSSQFVSNKTTYGSASNVAPANTQTGPNVIGQWFKKTFSSNKGFASFEDKQQQQQYQQPQAAGYQQQVYAYNPTPAYQPQPAQTPQPASRAGVKGSLTDSDYSSNVQRRRDAAMDKDMSSLKPAKKAGPSTPAKKLLKVTGGRAMANAQELTTFRDTFTAESIGELAEGLDDKDWKVKVRAILGLEVIAEQYGIAAVAKVKNQVLGLVGAPQSSLRTSATRFYAAIKDVEPAEPTQVSAFSFLEDQPDTIVVGEDGEVVVEETAFFMTDAAEQPQEETPAEPEAQPEEEEQAEHNEEEAEHVEEEEKQE